MRYLAEVNPPTPEFDQLAPHAELTFMPLETVWADGRHDASRVKVKSEVMTGYTRFRDGDILLPKVTPTFQAGRVARVHGLTRGVGAGTTELHVLRARPGVDPRYVAYALRSKHFIEEGVTAFQGVAGLQRVPDRFVSDFKVADLPLDEQVRIANFLDAETARLNRLTELLSQQRRLNSERASVVVDQSLSDLGLRWPQALDAAPEHWGLPVGWRLMALSRVLRELTNGYVGPTRDILEVEGVRYIQGTHIKHGEIDFNRRPFYVTEDWHRKRRRVNLRAGDVLIVQTGDIGQVAVVPQDFGEASCHALQIARVREDLVSGEYLGLYLRSRFGYNSLLSRATGALHLHLEAGIRDVPVVVPPLEVQARMTVHLAAARRRSRLLDAALRAQVALVAERRAAVITAAVTGQLDVSTARGAA